MKNLITIIIIFSSLLFLTNCQSNSSTGGYDKPLTEKELKAQLQQTECTNAAKYLEGNLRYEPKFKNALSMKVTGLKITCNISSNATLATFKDIKARAEFTSKTGAKIFEQDFDIYEFITPNGSIVYKSEFEITNQQFKDIATFSWTIIQASCK